MNRKWLIGFLIVLGIAVTAFMLTRQPQTPSPTKNQAAVTQSPRSQPISADQVPAHYEQVPSLSSLGPTLAPERFSGKAREAYKAVRVVPQLIAQFGA